MGHVLKTSVRITVKNWTSLLLFEILYKVFCYSILNAVVNNLLVFALDAAGIPFLSFENISRILTSPVAVLVMAGIAFLIIICTFFEVSVLYLYCQKGWENDTISLPRLVAGGVKKCGRLFHIKTAAFFIGFLVITPLSVLPYSNFIPGFQGIPEFILDYIMENKVLAALFFVVVAVLNFIFIYYLFSLPFLLLEKKTVVIAWKEAASLMKKNHIRLIGRVLLTLILFLLVFLAAGCLFVCGLSGYVRLSYPASDAANVFRFLVKNWSRTGIVLAQFTGTIWLTAVVTASIHDYRGEVSPSLAKKKSGLLTVAGKAVTVVCVAVILTIYSETELGGNVIYHNDKGTKVVAHRAGASFAPENTLAALDTAASAGADEAEIDVQQLKDGTLIIMHDSNFRRTAGVKKSVWEVDYGEVTSYDGGSYFSVGFAGEPIPLLEDMLKSAKNKIRLMIELKLTGHEDAKELAEQTLELIERYDMVHQCSIASMNLEILKTVKKLDSRFQTVYIAPLLYSGQYDMDFIDSYSVETTSVTREMTASAHYQGKKVYGWTANTKESIEKNMECRVDGIVTDNPELVNFYLKGYGENLLLDEVTGLFFPDKEKE